MRNIKLDKFFDIGNIVLILFGTCISIASFALGILVPSTATPWLWGALSIIMIVISIVNINKYKRKFKE